MIQSQITERSVEMIIAYGDIFWIPYDVNDFGRIHISK